MPLAIGKGEHGGTVAVVSAGDSDATTLLFSELGDRFSFQRRADEERQLLTGAFILLFDAAPVIPRGVTPIWNFEYAEVLGLYTPSSLKRESLSKPEK